MKNLRILLLCFLTTTLLGCEGSQNEEISYPSVEEYIEQLKQGTYQSGDLPEFNSDDIPKLLEYANEIDLIVNFPINRISSYLQNECTLGMYVLWTVESIRAVSIRSENLIGRFPSQNPIVQKEGESFEGVNGTDFQVIISNAYLDWWKTNEGKSFDEFKQIDPLSGTDLKWH